MCNKLAILFSDNIIYPGVIGNLCKFKNFHEFIDYVLLEIKNLLKYKETNIVDLKSYKNNLDTMIQSFKIKIDNVIRSCCEFANTKIIESENRIINNLKLYDDIKHQLDKIEEEYNEQ